MPMIVRPRRWRTPTYGGYLTPRPGNLFIKQRNKPYHQEIRHADLTQVYDSVNHVQDTPWRINCRVLAVLAKVWGGGRSEERSVGKEGVSTCSSRWWADH